MKFFISYSHSDSKLAGTIAKMLDNEGISYFLDEKNINYGDNIAEEVSQNLANASHMTVIISPGSSKSLWVPYEIGLAKAYGLRIVPVLQHPDIDVPTYISNLKYCKDLAEFSTFLIDSFEGELSVDVNIRAGEMIILEGNYMVFAIHNIEVDDEVAKSDVTPALILEVRNKSGNEIKLAQPFISFKKPQKGLIPGKELTAIGIPFSLDENHVVLPNATDNFYFSNPRNIDPQTSLMRGVINAFVRDNIDSITVESKDGRKKIHRVKSIGNLSEIVRYYRQRFPLYCVDVT